MIFKVVTKGCRFFFRVDPFGLAGQLITDALNPSIYTYEVAPVFTLMETQVLNEMLKIVGFPEGEGIFSPGGSMANGFAVNLARYRFDPHIKVRDFSDLEKFSLELLF